MPPALSLDLLFSWLQYSGRMLWVNCANEKVYGPDYPTVAIRVNNLGGVLRDQGELKEARKYLERALKIFQDKLGPDNPNTRIVANNLNSLGQD